jgi:CheY-like chemotaxis protein
VEEVDLSGLRLLLIDDSRSFLSLLTDVLHGFGIREITRTSDAIEAFEIIGREALDVALVDYEMPLINGIEFANMVRTAPDSRNKFLSMILLTSHCSRKVVMESLKAGFDDFLAKPMRPDHLRQKLTQLTQNPKNYVLTPSGYFGPDRRRRTDPQFGQEERRREDLSIVVGPRDLRNIERVQRMAEIGQRAQLEQLWKENFKDLTAQKMARYSVDPAARQNTDPVPADPIKSAVKMVSADS